LHLEIHGPEVRVARVGDEAVGARHEADEDRHLLGDEEGREREAHQDAEVLAAVAHEHLERDEDHRRTAFRRRAAGPWRPWSEKATMWSARASTSRSSGQRPSRRSMTGLQCL